MSNVGGLAAMSLGDAIERLRGKWGAIVAFGVLLVVLGLRGVFFALIADHRDGDAQRRGLSDRRRGRDRQSACIREAGAGSSSG